MTHNALDELKINGNFQHFWSSVMNAIPSMFKSKTYRAFHMELEQSTHKPLVKDLLFLTAEMFGFRREDVAEDLWRFVTLDQTVVISMQPLHLLDRSLTWRQLYKPYNRKYGVFTTLKEKTLSNNIHSEIRNYIVDNNVLPYKQVAVYNAAKDIVGWFVIDNEAEKLIKKENLRFIYQNGRPYTSKFRSYAVDLFFQKGSSEEFVFLNGVNDLRFRSIGVGDFGVKFLHDRAEKESRCKLAEPIYRNDMANYFDDFAKGFRHENEDRAATIDTNDAASYY